MNNYVESPVSQAVLWRLLLFSPLCSGRKGRFFFPTSDSNLTLPQPGVTGGYETYDHASSHFTWVYSNITNIYEKVQVNRKTIGGKCSRTRCDKTLTKVKKVKAELELLNSTTTSAVQDVADVAEDVTQLMLTTTFMNEDLEKVKTELELLKATTNITMLEEVVAIVQNSSVADLLVQLQKSLASQNDQIIALQTELEIKSGQISTLESALETQSSSVSDLESSLASQTSEVESHTSLLESQSTKLEEIESKLTDLDSSVRLDICIAKDIENICLTKSKTKATVIIRSIGDI